MLRRWVGLACLGMLLCFACAAQASSYSARTYNLGEDGNRLKLREQPSTKSAILGQYYTNVLVEVLEEQGDWAHVRVGDGLWWKAGGRRASAAQRRCGRGWRRCAGRAYAVAFGKDMSHAQSFGGPALSLREELREDELSLYAQPNENAAVTAVPKKSSPRILGVVGNEWYHVLFQETGEMGYMKQALFWPGNG